MIAFELSVVLPDGVEVLDVFGKMDVLFENQLFDGGGLVDGTADQVHDHPFRGKSFTGSGHAQGRFDQIDDAFGVAPVNNGKIGADPEVMPVLAKQDVGGGVKGAAHDPATGLIGQLAGAPHHLLCGPAGEGEQEDGFRRNAFLHQVGHPIHERPGFTRSCPCNDKNRAVAVGDRCVLRGVEHLGIDERWSGRRIVLKRVGKEWVLHADLLPQR